MGLASDGLSRSGVLTSLSLRTEIRFWFCCGGGVMEEFYRGFAQRARDLAERADPFTRRRLLDLALRYDARSKPGAPGARPLPPPRATPPAAIFSGLGKD